MGNLNLCASILLLCLARSSLQGGMKPQAIGRGSLYLPSLIRGAGGMQPGGGIGPAGAKAGKYPGYGSQAAPAGLGYGVPAGYGAGYRGVGYPRAGLPLGGLGARGKPSKSGYGAGRSSGGSYSGQQAYLSGVGAGSYLGNGPQNGYNNGYGPGGNGFAGAGPQPSGYGNGAQALYGSPLGGPAGDSAAAKYGGGGQLPYSGQPRQAEAAGLGGDYGPGRYGDSSQMPYGAQPASLDAEGKPRSYGNGNGMRYVNGGDLQANGLGAAAYGPLTAGQAPGGYGSQLGYRGKESKYGMNGFLGNGYRGRCASGKC